jgi:hypothetical protein
MPRPWRMPSACRRPPPCTMILAAAAAAATVARHAPFWWAVTGSGSSAALLRSGRSAHAARRRAHRAVADLVTEWKRASDRQCVFEAEYLDDGSVLLRDTRAANMMRETVLPPHEARLLAFVDEVRPLIRLTKLFAEAEPAAFYAMGGEAGLTAILDRWEEDGTALRVSGMVQCLPTWVATVQADDPVLLETELVHVA